MTDEEREFWMDQRQREIDDIMGLEVAKKIVADERRDRLECLRLAVQFSRASELLFELDAREDPVELAAKFYAFVKGDFSAAAQPDQAPSRSAEAHEGTPGSEEARSPPGTDPPCATGPADGEPEGDPQSDRERSDG
jgi:hypothetical protein